MNLNGYIESAKAIFDRYPDHLDFIKSVSLQQSIHYFTSEYLSSLWKEKGYADLFVILMYIEVIVCDYDMDETSYKIIVSELNVAILTLYDQASVKVKQMIYLTIKHLNLDDMKNDTKSFKKLSSTICKLYEKAHKND